MPSVKLKVGSIINNQFKKMVEETNNEEWEEVDPSKFPTWEPKIDEEVVGTLEKIETNIGPNKSKLYTLKQENDEMIKVWGSTVLDKRFDFISLGEKVKIVYCGIIESQSGGGRKYKDFKVFHSKAKNKENVLPSEGEEIIPEEIS